MIIPKVICAICNRQFKAITHTHTMKAHGMHLKEYMLAYPDAPIFESPVKDSKELLLDAVRRNFGDS